MDNQQLILLTKPADGQSLCRSCYWSHIQKGYRESEEAVFCCFGRMRAVKFKVRDCTDYFNKILPTRDQMEKIALIIPTQPARKHVGFTRAGFALDEFEDEDECVASQCE